MIDTKKLVLFLNCTIRDRDIDISPMYYFENIFLFVKGKSSELFPQKTLYDVYHPLMINNKYIKLDHSKSAKIKDIVL